MTTYHQRPLSFGEVLDAAMSLYAGNFGTFVGATAVCLGPSSVIAVLMQSGASAGLMRAGRPGFELEGLGSFFALLAAYLLAYLVGFFLASGATVRIVSEAYLGGRSTVGDALGFALKRFWRVLFAGFAATIVTGFAFLLLFVPGIIVAAGYSIVTQAAVLEPLPSSMSALDRSWQLTKGFKWRALGLVVISQMIVGVPAAIPGFVTAFSPSLQAPMLVVAELLKLVLLPILPCVLTVYYYDLRVRKEAFDLELLSQQLGAPAPS